MGSSEQKEQKDTNLKQVEIEDWYPMLFSDL